MSCAASMLASASTETPKLGDLRKSTSVEARPKKELTTPHKAAAGSYQKAASASLPYFYSFETPSIADDGWLIEDNEPSLSKTTTIVNAPYGNYVLFSQYSSLAPRNMWAFSPSFTLTAGTEYFVSIYVYAPGYNGAKDEFRVTVGSDQTAGSQTTVLIDKSGASATTYSNWTLLEGSFTPTADGNYYFGINHGTSVTDANFVEFDAFAITPSTPIVYPPSAQIYTWNGGLWSATSDDNEIYLSPAEAVTYTAVNASNTNSYAWTFADAAPSNSSDPQLAVVYDLDGSKSANLQITGNGGSTQISSDLLISRPQNGISDYVWNITPSEGLESYTFCNYNYLVGLNSYYKRIAEKYTLPSTVEVELSSVDLYVAKYTISSENINNNVLINVYSGGTDGLPNTLLGSYTTTYGSLFGSSPITTTTIKGYSLPAPLAITGSFFIEIDLSGYTSNPTATNNLGFYSSPNRISFLKYNTTYVYLNNKWNSTTELTSATISAGIAPSLSFKTPGTNSNNKEIDVKKGVQFSDNGLQISGASTGEGIKVFDLSGKLIFSATAVQGTLKYPLSLRKGLYFVKVGSETTKLLVG